MPQETNTGSVINRLTGRETLDVTRHFDEPFDKSLKCLETIEEDGLSAKAIEVLYFLRYLIARRDDAKLTFDAVLEYPLVDVSTWFRESVATADPPKAATAVEADLAGADA